MDKPNDSTLSDVAQGSRKLDTDSVERFWDLVARLIARRHFQNPLQIDESAVNGTSGSEDCRRDPE